MSEETSNGLWDDAEIICAYTRAQALQVDPGHPREGEDSES